MLRAIQRWFAARRQHRQIRQCVYRRAVSRVITSAPAMQAQSNCLHCTVLCRSADLNWCFSAENIRASDRKFLSPLLRDNPCQDDQPLCRVPYFSLLKVVGKAWPFVRGRYGRLHLLSHLLNMKQMLKTSLGVAVSRCRAFQHFFSRPAA